MVSYKTECFYVTGCYCIIFNTKIALEKHQIIEFEFAEEVVDGDVLLNLCVSKCYMK